ncbi:twin transmembrane helix small protein [Phaeovulum sp.]|uniref:twin transmembrane helix small protein n=1 Tax=Phaeovulum sp. TaxID=2934796 RepID=UPI003564F53F
MQFGLVEIIAAIAVLVVVGTLVMGLGGFARSADPKTANRRMWWRVGAQAVALVLIVLTVWLRGRG